MFTNKKDPVSEINFQNDLRLCKQVILKINKKILQHIEKDRCIILFHFIFHIVN